MNYYLLLLTIIILTSCKEKGLENESILPTSYTMSKIEFSREACRGECPVYDLVLNRDSISTFRARYFNFSSKGELSFEKEEGFYTVKLNDSVYKKFEQYLNYINFEQLEEDYATEATDFPSAKLKITYDNGKTKEIDDYGLIGESGLQKLYENFNELRFNQDWKKQ